MLLRCLQESALRRIFTVDRQRLRDAVAEHDQPVAGHEYDGLLLEGRALEQPHDRTARLEPPHATLPTTRGGLWPRCNTSGARPAAAIRKSASRTAIRYRARYSARFTRAIV